MLIEKGNNHATTYAIYAVVVVAVAAKQCSSSVLIISSNGRLLKYPHFLCILRLRHKPRPLVKKGSFPVFMNAAATEAKVAEASFPIAFVAVK